VKGTRLAGYEIIDKLGEGGMGEVWRARDEQLGRVVAIKVLPADLSGDPDRRTRFEYEARALAALNHPNIVSVFGAGEYEGRSFIVSELVDGESLRAVIERGRVPFRKIVDIAVQIAEGIAAAHAAGIVHRDLKPENIMLTPEGRVKVLDFGLAKKTARGAPDATATALSQPGLVMGTAGYMSPEQVRGELVDSRSDIFSFGVVLYELVTGKRAFSGASAVDTMHAVMHEDPPEAGASDPGFSPALNTIIRRCLEKRPDQRFQSAADLAFALRAVSATTISAQHATPVGPRAVAKRKQSWLMPVLALAAGCAVFAAGYYLRDRGAGKNPPIFQRITFRTGLVTNARFVPGGHNVVYSAKWETGPSRIYLAAPGTPESRDLQMPEDSVVSAVSSREEILFLAAPFSVNGTGTLSRGSVSGGQMRPSLEDVLIADWTADGASMAVLRLVNGKTQLEYPVGTAVWNAASAPLLSFRISPDGSHLAIAHFYRGSSIAITVVDSADPKAPGKLLGVVSDQTPNRVDAVISWSPDGKEVLFRSFDPKEWGTIYAMDMKGHRRIVMRAPGHLTLYDVASDGRMLIRTDNRQVGILGWAWLLSRQSRNVLIPAK
jgi:eukaryotic-like serine/threonine-protein kinase